MPTGSLRPEVSRHGYTKTVLIKIRFETEIKIHLDTAVPLTIPKEEASPNTFQFRKSQVEDFGVLECNSLYPVNSIL